VNRLAGSGVTVASALALGLVGACSSEGNEQVTPPNQQVAPTCRETGTDPACVLTVGERSFVQAVFPATDGISTAVVKHTPGTFCMSGTVDSGPNDWGWGALLLMSFGDVNTLTPFDASALGIAQIRFNLQDPPPTGVLPEIDQLESAHCTEVHCIAVLDRAAAVTTPGTVTVPLTDFTQPDGAHPDTALDPTLLVGLNFYVPSLPGKAVDYGFCIHDLEFLDADGRPLTP
jgi:hypothetical protein